MNGYEENIKDRLFLEIYNASLVKEGSRLVCERREDLAVVCRFAGYDEEFDKKSVEVSKRLGDVYEQIAAHHGISFLRAADYAHCSGIDEEHLDAEGHSRLAEAVYNKILRDIISEAA